MDFADDGGNCDDGGDEAIGVADDVVEDVEDGGSDDGDEDEDVEDGGSDEGDDNEDVEDGGSDEGGEEEGAGGVLCAALYCEPSGVHDCNISCGFTFDLFETCKKIKKRILKHSIDFK